MPEIRVVQLAVEVMSEGDPASNGPATIGGLGVEVLYAGPASGPATIGGLGVEVLYAEDIAPDVEAPIRLVLGDDQRSVSVFSPLSS